MSRQIGRSGTCTGRGRVWLNLVRNLSFYVEIYLSFCMSSLTISPQVFKQSPTRIFLNGLCTLHSHPLSVLLSEDGGIIDDTFVIEHASDAFCVVTSAGRHERDLSSVLRFRFKYIGFSVLNNFTYSVRRYLTPMLCVNVQTSSESIGASKSEDRLRLDTSR
jgi:hypothetical protein